MSAKKPTVEEFLADLDHPRVDDIRRIRTALLNGDPELGERIKWNAPSFGHDGDNRVTFRLQPRDPCELVFHRGVHKRDDPFSFEDADQLINWAASDRGTTVVPVGMTDDDETRLVDLAPSHPATHTAGETDTSGSTGMNTNIIRPTPRSPRACRSPCSATRRLPASPQRSSPPRSRRWAQPPCQPCGRRQTDPTERVSVLDHHRGRPRCRHRRHHPNPPPVHHRNRHRNRPVKHPPTRTARRQHDTHGSRARPTSPRQPSSSPRSHVT